MGIETAMMAAAIGSGVLGGIGTLKAGQAQEASAKSQAVMLDAQAREEEWRAGQERAMAQRRAEEKQIDTERLMGKQRAIAAASGAGTSGTAGLIEAETAGEGAFQSELELFKGEERARGLETQAEVDRYSAVDKRRSGAAGRRASYIQAGSQVLGSVANAYSMGGKSGGGSKSGVYY